MPASGVKFKLGTDVVSEEVYAAFHDEPLSVAFPAATGTRLTAAEAGPTYAPPDFLDATQVGGMLAENDGAWTLAVLKNDATGVLDGKLLKEVWNKGTGVVELPLRSPTPGEHLVLADSDALY